MSPDIVTVTRLLQEGQVICTTSLIPILTLSSLFCSLSLSLSLLPSTLIPFSPPKVWDVVKGEIPTFPAGLVNEMRSYN